ncbi:hypothetical protein HBI56_059470 [Parastagonospora nodorum]|nr:hypothetical protein HBH52_170780 [Parastagonospora nodorum]KAH4002375.1 hypothetical protein HBI10_072320 [Parastagonospora nodorum]KAH4018069.1 hypothetical protein HBI13_138810 [Parastagonospora nodorum]KAH4036308.1 hypothetical protein HBI09_085390 [Parastagonospora nodorum]KAH4106200.1 hypothetical protein HBH46_077440 [Parastagonospora nodorum]
MLFKVPIFACLASLAVADFDMFWFAENVLDVGVGAARYSGIKFLNKPPNCKDFVNGDADGTGVWCRVEVNDYNEHVFANGPWHFSECVCIYVVF